MMSSHSRKALGVILIVAACSAPPVKQAPVRVDVATQVAHVATVPDLYETTGTVHARTTSQLAAKVMGNVSRVLVAEGDRVQRGQLLLQIDPREADAQVRKARAGSDEIDSAIRAANAAQSAAAANAQLAQTTYDRFVILRNRGSVSAYEFDQVEAQQKSAAAELERARATYRQMLAKKSEAGADVDSALTFAGYAEIHSPLDGVVTAKFVDAGSQASPGMVLLTVESTDGRRVETTVPDDVLPLLHAGDIAGVENGHARIAQIVPSLDAATHTALVKLDVADDAQLRSGQLARVRFRIGEKRALMIPSNAIATRGALRSVSVVGADGVAAMRLVTTGRTFNGQTEIIAGLDDGERFAEGR